MEKNKNERPNYGEEGKKELKRPDATKLFRKGSVFVVVGCVLFACIMFCLCHFVEDWDMNKNANIGAMFGVMSAVFTGLAFAGVIANFIQQREELAKQAEDFDKRIESLNAQNAILQKRDFEDRFFKLLERQIWVRDNYYFRFGHEGFTGLKGMKKAYDLFINYTTKNSEVVGCEDAIQGEMYWEYIERKIGFSENEEENKKGLALPLVGRNANGIGEYLKSFKIVLIHSNLSHYADGLIQICEYVESVELLDSNKRFFYMRFLCNQITRIESCILFYYGLALSEIDHDDRLLSYLMRYSLLKYFDPLDFAEKNHDIQYVEALEKYKA